MGTPFRLVGQGISSSAKGADKWRDHFFVLRDEDLAEFQRFPSARFIVREREPEEVDRSNPLTSRRPGARELMTIFRSGHRDPYYEAPGWFALRRYVDRAEWALEDCPALQADAAYEQTCRLMGLGSPLVSGFIYVDAPGTMRMGGGKARIFKQFEMDRVDTIWEFIISEHQRRIDRERSFQRRRLNQYEGPRNFTVERLLR